ncbi:MAG: family 10 glycosylhydrolase, partial [Duncaniella sp.]|nr:family 10 glycosylhydrolase [Duncaniella sp.]
HKTIADIRAMISDTKPWVRLGVSPAGVAGKDDTSAEKWGAEPVNVKANDWQYGEIYSDPLGLMYQGTIDFVSPQIYWAADHATAPYEPLARWWSATASTYDTHVYPSVTLERMDKGGTLSAHRRELLNQIDANRRHCTHGEGGTIIYSAKFLPRVSGVLWRGPWSRPVLMPRLRHGGAAAQTDATASVSGLRLESGRLHWTAAPDVRRCAVYAVPRGVPHSEIFPEGGDGIDAAYLLGVAYGGSIQVPDGLDYRYAVCALDDNADEGAPVWID